MARCFLVMYGPEEPPVLHPTAEVQERPPATTPGCCWTTPRPAPARSPRGMFPTHDLLPARCAHDLETGALVMQPLSVPRTASSATPCSSRSGTW